MEKGAFPPCFYKHKKDIQNLMDTLELYFQFCSILSTNRQGNKQIGTPRLCDMTFPRSNATD